MPRGKKQADPPADEDRSLVAGDDAAKRYGHQFGKNTTTPTHTFTSGTAVGANTHGGIPATHTFTNGADVCDKL